MSTTKVRYQREKEASVPRWQAIEMELREKLRACEERESINSTLKQLSEQMSKMEQVIKQGPPPAAPRVPPPAPPPPPPSFSFAANNRKNAPKARPSEPRVPPKPAMRGFLTDELLNRIKLGTAGLKPTGRKLNV